MRSGLLGADAAAGDHRSSPAAGVDPGECHNRGGQLTPPFRLSDYVIVN